jgi:hypothetical protein
VAEHLKPKQFDTVLREELAAGPLPVRQLFPAVRRHGYTNTGTDFTIRLNRRVGRGLLAKLLVKGTNQYLLTEHLLGAEKEFDLTDDAARKVAADWLEERGKEDLARLLRQATRFTCGAGKGAGP